MFYGTQVLVRFHGLSLSSLLLHWGDVLYHPNFPGLELEHVLHSPVDLGLGALSAVTPGRNLVYFP